MPRARLPGPARGWPLGARLAGLVFCGVAAGGGAMTVAAHVVAGDYLTRQAHQQLSAYAAQLTSRPFTLFPGDPVAPGVSGLGATSPALGVAVLDAGGQQLISAGRATPPAAGGGWLEVSEPVSYQAKHILFAYGAEDSSFSVTSKTRSGYAGRLVIGLDLASVGQAVDGLTVTCLRATGLAVLLATAAAAGATGVLRRRRAPAAGAETRDAAERSSAAAADVCRQLRRPLSVLAGLAEYHRRRGELGDDDAERMLHQVARETGHIAGIVDQLEAAAPRAGARKRLDGG
jgi:signal transduction histidine kinase